MPDPKHHSTRLRPWREGNELSARHLDEPREALSRLLTPPVSVREVIRPKAEAVVVQQFRLVAVAGDFLWCERGEGSPTNDGADDRVRVAKTPLLRRTPWEDDGRDNITFEYTSDTERTATNASDDTESQEVVPSYVVGDVIYAERGILGGTGVWATDVNGKEVEVEWLDQNLDARAWAVSA